MNLREKIAEIVNSTNGVDDLQQALKECLEVPKRSSIEVSQTIQLLNVIATRLSKGTDIEKSRANIIRGCILRLRTQNRRITL
jgi:hypothetical protein